MSRWFRFYDDAMNDPKLLRLSDEYFRAWTTLLCIASKNGGKLPPAGDIALMLRLKLSKVSEWLAALVSGGLIDRDGDTYAPHNWDGRQYKSDTSNERVKRFRDKKCNVTDAVTVTAPEQIQITEQKKEIGTVAKQATPTVGFYEFWKVIPKRSGANPKAPAEKLFAAAVKAGTPCDVIIAAAARWAVADANKIGTEFLPQAVKWLRDKRWLDYPHVAETPTTSKYYAKVGSEQLDAWDAHIRASTGKTLPRDKLQGWLVDTEWPPGYVPPERSHEIPPPNLRSMQ